MKDSNSDVTDSKQSPLLSSKNSVSSVRRETHWCLLTILDQPGPASCKDSAQGSKREARASGMEKRHTSRVSNSDQGSRRGQQAAQHTHTHTQLTQPCPVHPWFLLLIPNFCGHSQNLSITCSLCLNGLHLCLGALLLMFLNSCASCCCSKCGPGKDAKVLTPHPYHIWE